MSSRSSSPVTPGSPGLAVPSVQVSSVFLARARSFFAMKERFVSSAWLVEQEASRNKRSRLGES